MFFFSPFGALIVIRKLSIYFIHKIIIYCILDDGLCSGHTHPGCVLLRVILLSQRQLPLFLQPGVWVEAAVATQPPQADGIPGWGAPRASSPEKCFPDWGLGVEPAPPSGQKVLGLRGIWGGAAELGGSWSGGAGLYLQEVLAAFSLHPNNMVSFREWRWFGAPPPPLLVVQGQGVKGTQIFLPLSLHLLLWVQPPASSLDSSCVRVCVAEGEHRVQAAAELLGPRLALPLPGEPRRAGKAIQLILQTIIGWVSLRVEPEVCSGAERGKKRTLHPANWITFSSIGSWCSSYFYFLRKVFEKGLLVWLKSLVDTT